MTDASVPGDGDGTLDLLLKSADLNTKLADALDERDALKAEVEERWKSDERAHKVIGGLIEMREKAEAEVERLTAELEGRGPTCNAAHVFAVDLYRCIDEMPAIETLAEWRAAVAVVISRAQDSAALSERRKIAAMIVGPLLEKLKCCEVNGDGRAAHDAFVEAEKGAERWCAEVREQGGNP